MLTFAYHLKNKNTNSKAKAMKDKLDDNINYHRLIRCYWFRAVKYSDRIIQNQLTKRFSFFVRCYYFRLYELIDNLYIHFGDYLFSIFSSRFQLTQFYSFNMTRNCRMHLQKSHNDVKSILALPLNCQVIDSNFNNIYSMINGVILTLNQLQEDSLTIKSQLPNYKRN